MARRCVQHDAAGYEGGELCENLYLSSHETNFGIMGHDLGAMWCTAHYGSMLSLTTKKTWSKSVFERPQGPKD